MLGLRLAVFCVVVTLSAPATGWGWTHRGAKWPRSDMPIRYSIHNALAKNLTDGRVLHALRLGFDVWSDPDCAWAESQYIGRTDNFQFGRDDGKNVVSWRFNAWSESDNAIAVTSTITGFSQNIRDSDMIFNDVNFSFDTQGGRNQMDVRAIATHEAGHFFGLGHSAVRQATMFPSTGAGNLGPRDLHEDDENGICDLYAAERIPGVAMGEPCGEGCEQGEVELVCLDDVTADGIPYCTQACEFRDDCPDGYFCVDGGRGGEDKYCRRYPEGAEPGADLGDACSSEETGEACQIGLFCARDGRSSYCTGKCQDTSSPLVSASCPEEYCCEARRGGIYACLLLDEGEDCEGFPFEDELDVDEPAPDGEGDDDEGSDEGEEAEEPPAGDGSVDNSLCTTAPSSPSAAWSLLFRR